jgi:hypothetical protein
MAGARYSRAGITPGGHTGSQVARREAAMKRVRDLLAEKPRSAFDLSAVMHLPSSTIYGYLRTLEAFDEAYQMAGVDHRGRKTWAICVNWADVSSEKVQSEHAKRARIVKAEQIGMPRDPLVAAMFGPAPGGAA